MFYQIESPEELPALAERLGAEKAPLAVAANAGSLNLSDGKDTWALSKLALEDLSALQPAFNDREIVLQDGRSVLGQLGLRKLTAEKTFCVTSARSILFNGIDAPEMGGWFDNILPGSSADLDEEGRMPASSLLELRSALDVTLTEQGLGRVMNMEGQLLPVILKMEDAGMSVDRDKFRLLYDEMEGKCNVLGAEIRKSLGVPDLDLNSVESIVAAFNKNGVDIKRTGDDILASLSHPAADMLRDYRSLQIQGRQAVAYMAAIGPDGRIHGTFDPFGAETGRFSCSEPNLQGIAGGPVRHCFSVMDGRDLICADYSQIELRALATVAKVPAMLKAFQEGIDIHSQTMSFLLNKPIDQVTKEERQKGKAVNFGLIYGQKAEGLKGYAKRQYNVDLTLEEAQQFRERWFKLYPEVEAYHNRAWAEVRDLKRKGLSGEVRTKLGRRRFFPEDASDWERYSRLVNTPIQGLCGDAFKIAMIGISRHLPKGANLVSVIHDEIVVECARAQTPEVSKIVEREMMQAMKWLIPDVAMQVETKVSPSFGQKDGAPAYPFDYSRLDKLPPVIEPTQKSVAAQLPLLDASPSKKKPAMTAARSAVPAGAMPKDVSDLALLNMAMPISFVWEKCNIAKPAEFAEKGGFKCCSPFRADKNPSFSVYHKNGVDRFVDHSIPAGMRKRGIDMGGSYDLFKLAKGITNNSVGVKEFLKLGNYPQSRDPKAIDSWRKKLLAKLDFDPSQQQEQVWPPEEKPKIPYRFTTGTNEQHKALCTIRGFSPAGVRLAVQEGMLRFGAFLKEESWFVTSPESRNISARRLNGEKWDIPRLRNPKAMGLKGSTPNWPLGIENVESRPFAAVCEGGPDFIAAHDFVAAAGLQGKVAVVGLLGTDAVIHPSLMPKFKDKKVVVFAHCDNAEGKKEMSAGEVAASFWTADMEKAGAKIHTVNFTEIGKKLGVMQPIKDLCDLLPHRDKFKANRLFGFLTNDAPVPAANPAVPAMTPTTTPVPVAQPTASVGR